MKWYGWLNMDIEILKPQTETVIGGIKAGDPWERITPHSEKVIQKYRLQGNGAIDFIYGQVESTVLPVVQ